MKTRKRVNRIAIADLALLVLLLIVMRIQLLLLLLILMRIVLLKIQCGIAGVLQCAGKSKSMEQVQALNEFLAHRMRSNHHEEVLRCATDCS